MTKNRLWKTTPFYFYKSRTHRIAGMRKLLVARKLNKKTANGRMQCACRKQLQPHNLPKLHIARENQGTRCLVLSRVCLRTPRVEELGSSGWGKWQYAHRSSLWQPSVDVCNTHGSQVPSACAARSASAGWGQLQANANFQVPGLCHPLSSKPGPKRSFYFAGFLASICNLKLETSESQKSQKCCHEMYTYKL